MGGANRSDIELIAGICARDDSAFEELFARFYTPIHAHLVRMLRDACAAEDITQEVFLRVWTSAGQWRGEGSLQAWVTRIATNLALNHVRTVRRRRELPLETGSEGADWDAHRLNGSCSAMQIAGPERAAEEMEWRERLQRHIERLSDDKRLVFHMAHGAEMDVREISRRLGIPEGTVRSRLHYARKQIARDLNDDLHRGSMHSEEEQ